LAPCSELEAGWQSRAETGLHRSRPRRRANASGSGLWPNPDHGSRCPARHRL